MGCDRWWHSQTRRDSGEWQAGLEAPGHAVFCVPGRNDPHDAPAPRGEEPKGPAKQARKEQDGAGHQCSDTSDAHRAYAAHLVESSAMKRDADEKELIDQVSALTARW
jgi:hypothetical protein